MLSINFRPALTGPTITNRIHLTDSAYSNASIVYVDREYAPSKDSLVWVTITDPENPSEYMLQRWMYVEQVLYEDYVDMIIRDGNGDPILDGEGNVQRKTVIDQPGWVLLILREHKHTLMKSKFEDMFNIPSLLSHILLEYGAIEKYNSFNELDWEGLQELIYHRGVGLISEGEERPPIVPVNLYWRNLHLADGLDDLLFHFSSRVVEEAVVIPDTDFLDYIDDLDYFLDNPELFSQLTWKKRRPYFMDETVSYDTMTIPNLIQEQIDRERDNSAILFTLSSGRDFERIETPLSTSTGEVLRCDKVIAGGDRTAIRNYLKDTFINVNLFYEFTTRRLPKSYLLNTDWSNIEYVFEPENYYIRVDHQPRLTNRILPSVVPTRTETFSGRVVNQSPNYVTIRDISNDSSPHRDVFLRESINLPFSFERNLTGENLNFQIANNALTPLSTDSLYSPWSDGENVQPLHDGYEVESIRHFIEYLDFVCPDEALDFSINPIYNYKYHSHETNTDHPDWFNEMIYEIELGYGDFWFITPPVALNWTRVRFELIATQEELETFLVEDANFTINGPEYAAAAAEFWNNTFRFVDIYFWFSRDPRYIDWAYSPVQPSSSVPVDYGPALGPDIDSVQFSGPKGGTVGASQAFPIIFPLPGTPVTAPVTGIEMSGHVGFIYQTLVDAIAVRYISNHLETFAASVHLELGSSILSESSQSIMSFPTQKVTTSSSVPVPKFMDKPITRTSRFAVVSVCVGPGYQKLRDITWPRFKEYANYVNADFIGIDDDQFPAYPIGNKFRVGTLTQYYDRVLFLDADVWLMHDVGNLFQIFYPGVIWMHEDWHSLPDTNWIAEEMKQMKIEQGIVRKRPSRCFNTGVVIWDDQHSSMWNPPPKRIGTRQISEQFWVEYQAQFMEMRKLPSIYNFQYYRTDFNEKLKYAKIIHYANAPLNIRIENLSKHATHQTPFV